MTVIHGEVLMKKCIKNKWNSIGFVSANQPRPLHLSRFYKELCPNLWRGSGEFMKLLHSALQDLGLTYSPPQYVLLLKWAILHSQCLSTKGRKWDISICLGVWGNLQWTNVQSRGNRNTLRSFVGIESNWNASEGRLVGLWHLYSFVVLFQYKIFFKVTEQ